MVFIDFSTFDPPKNDPNVERVLRGVPKSCQNGVRKNIEKRLNCLTESGPGNHHKPTIKKPLSIYLIFCRREVTKFD